MTTAVLSSNDIFKDDIDQELNNISEFPILSDPTLVNNPDVYTFEGCQKSTLATSTVALRETGFFSFNSTEPILNNYDFDRNIKISDNFSTIKSFLVQQNYQKLHDIQDLGDSWSGDENIKGPEDFVIEFANYIIDELSKINIFPDRITPSAEEGLCLVFNNNGNTFYFEIYNDGDMGYIIEHRKEKKILENEDIEDLQILYDRLENFYK
jgi:hypothetical protein